MLDKRLLDYIHGLPLKDQESLIKLLDAKEEDVLAEKARSHFLPFVEATWDGFISGEHFKIISDAFDELVDGTNKRLVINLPPRHGKSSFASIRLPAYFLGRYPDKKIIAASHTADLSIGFGRQVRDLLTTPEYQRVFPGTTLKADAKAAGRWSTSKGGEYYAVGVGGALAGRGADLAIIDDSASEQTAMSAEYNADIWDGIFEWFNTGPRQRLQPGGRILILETRWSTKDLSGQVIKRSMRDEAGSDWKVIELPAILPSGRPLWPEYWSLEELNKVKADIPVQRWNAQYQQNPTAQEGAILKRSWWKRWKERDMPKCSLILQSWDTAYLATQRSDYSACTTWGVFETQKDEKKINNLILLDYFKDKLEFPALKVKVRDHFKEWRADTLVVEAKAVGSPLIFELRAMNIPVSEYTPTRGNDKIVRANAVADLFSSGMVWAPETSWADELMEECMPAGTKIITKKGLIPIEEISTGCEVLTHLGRFRPVIATTTRQADELVRIKTKSLEPIFITPGHPILTVGVGVDGGWVKASDILIRPHRVANRHGTEILEPYIGPYHRACLPIPGFGRMASIDLRGWKTTSQKSRQYSVIDDGASIRSSHGKALPVIYNQCLDGEFGWLLGMYLAEGSKTGHQATFSLGEREEYLILRVADILSRRVSKCSIGAPRNGAVKITVALGICGGFWDQFGRGAHNKKFPEWFWDGPHEFIKGVLDGYCAGDGHSSGGCSTAITVSENLAWNIRLALLSIGKIASISTIPAKTRKIMGRTHDCKKQYQIRWVDEPSHTCGKISDGMCSYSMMEKSNFPGETVYNLEVLEDNSYTTTGGIVHNCQAFPNGDCDDGVDTVTQALLRFRQGGLVTTEHDDEDKLPPRKRAAYY